MNSIEYKLWLENRNKRNLKRRTRKKQHLKNRRKRVHQLNYARKQKRDLLSKKRIVEDGFLKMPFVVPQNFSLTENFEETVLFFNDVLEYIFDRKKIEVGIKFDMSKVKSVTNDAIMYLLAIVKNVKAKCFLSGNLPIDENARKVVIESGFLSYVNSEKDIVLSKDTDKIQIKSGNTINQYIVKDICDFVIQKFNINRKQCRFLYDMLMEMMANTSQHAYNSNRLLNYWYLFVEKHADSIKFVFLDTGLGIPQTISKKIFSEKMNIIKEKTDAEYIYSALKGESRTRTTKGHRGKGLPKIYNYNEDGKIKYLQIISGRGLIEKNEKIVLKNKFAGTLFSWEIMKGDL